MKSKTNNLISYEQKLKLRLTSFFVILVLCGLVVNSEVPPTFEVMRNSAGTFVNSTT